MLAAIILPLVATLHAEDALIQVVLDSLGLPRQSALQKFSSTREFRNQVGEQPTKNRRDRVDFAKYDHSDTFYFDPQDRLVGWRHKGVPLSSPRKVVETVNLAYLMESMGITGTANASVGSDSLTKQIDERRKLNARNDDMEPRADVIFRMIVGNGLAMTAVAGMKGPLYFRGLPTEGRTNGAIRKALSLDSMTKNDIEVHEFVVTRTLNKSLLSRYLPTPSIGTNKIVFEVK